MDKRIFVPVVLACGTALAAFAQERVKPKGPPDFAALHASIGEHWKAQRWGACSKDARTLLGVISTRRAKAIREALPAAPDGYAKEEPKEEDTAQANAMMAAFAPGVGTVVEQQYQGQGKNINVTVTADSPLLQMYQMLLQNPAMLQPGQELIKYTQCSAILETQGGSNTLRFMIDSSMVEANFHDESPDFALKMFDQAAVTKLHAAISL
jgi:hypothetical protein